MADKDNMHIGAGALTIAGTDIGYTTEEGVVIHFEPDVHFHLSGKYGTTPVKASLLGEKVEIEIWMAEHTLANMERAYAGATGASGGKLKLGGVSGIEIEGVEIELTPFDGTPAWVFRNAVQTGSIDANYKVSDERIIQVTFTALVATGVPEDENLAYAS